MVMLILLFIVAFGASSASHAQSIVSPGQAEAFVRAAIAINQVNEAWQPRIDQAKSELEAERLRDQANIAMRQAIRDVGGMTVEDYRTVYHAARRDPELAAYVTELFEKKVAEALR
jgi:hypothetical protein